MTVLRYIQKAHLSAHSDSFAYSCKECEASYIDVTPLYMMRNKANSCPRCGNEMSIDTTETILKALYRFFDFSENGTISFSATEIIFAMAVDSGYDVYFLGSFVRLNVSWQNNEPSLCLTVGYKHKPDTNRSIVIGHVSAQEVALENTWANEVVTFLNTISFDDVFDADIS